MRVLLASNASYAPPRGGSTRSNLVWLRHLAAHGHVCRVISAALADDFETVLDGVEIRGLRDLPRRAAVLSEEIQTFQPDFVLLSSEDISQVLLREARRAAAGKIVYLAHTPQFFPFGPESWNPNSQAAEVVRSARLVVTIGRHMADYVREHLGVRAVVIHPPIYGAPPFPRFGTFADGWVLMVNPCQVKGIVIFEELAKRFPKLPFAALAGWGTTSEDRARLANLPNVRLLESVPNIDEVLARTRLLLMPSLWYEGFGLIATEAMLRGIPVIASNSGGLLEAKQGTKYVNAVRPIVRYLREFDATHMPKPVVPEQDLAPWEEALSQLTVDRAKYTDEAERSRTAALRFVSTLDAAQLERELLRPRLRILLAHNSLYYPAHGGGDRSNRLLMEALAARGHEVHVAARRKSGEERFELNGVEVRTRPFNAPMSPFLREEIAAFQPNVIITSTDDPALLLFETARAAPQARLVYLVRATIAVPFGPDSSMPSYEKTQMLQQADGIVGVSEYVADYVRRQGGLDALHVPISLMDPGEWPDLGRFENPYVLMVNPCAVKGIDIFVELARRLPAVRFAGVPTWGTNASDLTLLRQEPNITILEAVDDIDILLRQARVVLVPSLWAEARSRIVVESMLRGVPVMASDAGGIREAKMGVPYLLPVELIRRYQASLDENMVPVAEVPPQDIAPWLQALERLTSDRSHWVEVARQSREAALHYAGNLSVEPFEKLLSSLFERPAKAAVGATAVDQRRLLARRLLTRMKQRSPWFPVSSKEHFRLFCFPPAGAGALTYLRWAGRISGVSVIPVLLPGRETRLAEPPFDNMEALIAALSVAVVEQELQRPYAFFGHSMGAGIAFELTRALRRKNAPGPELLVVSSARAPQSRLRLQPIADPSDEDLLEEVDRVGGNLEVSRQLLPVLRADTRLYRNYVYHPELPLSVPIRAYGGTSDPNVGTADLEGWREQTTTSFVRREFEGGHMYLRFVERLLAALGQDLQPFVDGKVHR